MLAQLSCKRLNSSPTLLEGKRLNKQAVLSIRTTDEFKMAVYAAASRAGVKTSEYIRDALRDKMYGKRPKERTRHD